jgi:hypothetical protein
MYTDDPSDSHEAELFRQALRSGMSPASAYRLLRVRLEDILASQARSGVPVLGGVGASMALVGSALVSDELGSQGRGSLPLQSLGVHARAAAAPSAPSVGAGDKPTDAALALVALLCDEPVVVNVRFQRSVVTLRLPAGLVKALRVRLGSQGFLRAARDALGQIEDGERRSIAVTRVLARRWLES